MNVKGTSRFSSHDKQLMRELWVADKDNALENKRKKRSLTQVEKAARQCMPLERAEAAVKNLRKKQKKFISKFEGQPSDDPIAVAAIGGRNWSEFCEKQNAMAFDVAVGKLHTRVDRKSQKVDEFIGRVHSLMSDQTLAATTQNGGDTDKSIRFLNTLKHKRMQNFHQKREEFERRGSTLLGAPEMLLSPAKRNRYQPSSSAKRVALKHLAAHEAVCDAQIDFVCDGCGEAVRSSDAVVLQRRLFYHRHCATKLETNRKEIEFMFF